MKKAIYLSIFLLVCITCKKEVPSLDEQSYSHCRDNIQFTCEEPLGDYYFRGKINGSEFCFSEGNNGYIRANGKGSTFVTPTSDPTWNPNRSGSTATFFNIGFLPPIKNNASGLLEEFSPYINILTPYIFDTLDYSSKEYFDRFIKLGDLSLMSKNTGYAEAFSITLSWDCAYLPSYEHYYEKDPYSIPKTDVGMNTEHGNQDQAVFKITEMETHETEEVIIYDLTFEIECDLYFWDSKDDYSYYGRLEDGKLKTQVVVPNDDNE